MSQIIFKERTAHLASYTLFTRDVDQYKNTSLSQLYQPARMSFSQNTYPGASPLGARGGLQSKYYCIGVHLV